MNEVRCSLHNTIVICEVVGTSGSSPESGPSESDFDWACECPIGRTRCDDHWFEVKQNA